MSDDLENLYNSTGLLQRQIDVDYFIEVCGTYRFGIHQHLDLKYPKNEESKTTQPKLSFVLKKLTKGKGFDITVERIIARMSTKSVLQVFDKVLTEAFETLASLPPDLLSKPGLVFYSHHLKEAFVAAIKHKIFIQGIVDAKGCAAVYLYQQNDELLPVKPEEEVKVKISEQNRFTILKLAEAINQNWGKSNATPTIQAVTDTNPKAGEK